MDKEAFCCTLEPPDKDNQQNVSCIPVGLYNVSRVHSPKYGNTFEITNVPNRTHVLFHAGNTIKHTRGCILLGQYFGKLLGDRAVLNSGKTFKMFLNKLQTINFLKLKIKEA